MNNTCVRCSYPAYSRGLCALCYTQKFNSVRSISWTVRRPYLGTRKELPAADQQEKERRIARYAEQIERGGILNYREVQKEQGDIEEGKVNKLQSKGL